MPRTIDEGAAWDVTQVLGLLCKLEAIRKGGKGQRRVGRVKRVPPFSRVFHGGTRFTRPTLRLSG